MTFNYCEDAESFVASGDLSGLQGRVVDILGTAPRVGHSLANRGYGILANKPRNLEHAAVVTNGIVKAKAGAAVAVGNYIASAASGWCVVATHSILDVASGSDYMQQNILGQALTAAASGFDFALNLDKRGVTFVASA